ncbi:hypothetical protein AB0N05_23875 [Nocardia sp. NPDC051030]
MNISTPEQSGNASWLGRAAGLGADWWSVIVTGVVVLLAVFDALPKIPW